MPEPLRLELVAAPAVEPLSLNEVKQHLKLEEEDGADDALIAGLIRVAREQAERFTGRALITQGYSLWLDAWPRRRDARLHEGWREGALTEGPAQAVELPRPPLQAVSTILAYDEADQATEFPASAYTVDRASQPGRVVLRRGAAAPVAARAANGIEIRFTAGYGDSPDAVPEAIRQGLLMKVAQLYEGRGDDPWQTVESTGAASLWRPYRVLRL